MFLISQLFKMAAQLNKLNICAFCSCFVDVIILMLKVVFLYDVRQLRLSLKILVDVKSNSVDLKDNFESLTFFSRCKLDQRCVVLPKFGPSKDYGNQVNVNRSKQAKYLLIIECHVISPFDS